MRFWIFPFGAVFTLLEALWSIFKDWRDIRRVRKQNEEKRIKVRMFLFTCKVIGKRASEF